MRAGILIFSAHVPELSALGRILGADLAATVGGHDVRGISVGIGLVAAAGGAALALRTFEAIEPRAVIFVGTCGAYAGQGVAVGDVVVGERICLVSTAVAESRGAFPPPMRTELASNAELAAGLAKGGERRVAIATTLAITTDDVLAARIAERTACHVEHLEAFAVAEACARANVRFAAVLGVANRVGSTARGEWQQNHHATGHAAGALVARWLERGAPGFTFDSRGDD
jgi:nucleoside phosphorylase